MHLSRRCYDSLSRCDRPFTGRHYDLATEAAALADSGGSENTASGDYLYVCNTNSWKFHYPDCPSVAKMKEKNRINSSLSRDELIAQGYQPCGNCHP